MSRPEQYYDQVQEIITRILTKLAWNELIAELFNLDCPFSDQELTNNECGVKYVEYTTENRAWTTSLILMSWILRNLQRKMEDGHCNNPTHRHGAVEPRNCEEGRTFHTNMFNMCLESYRDVIYTFDPPPQAPGDAKNTTNPKS